jgi:hypothetical protein
MRNALPIRVQLGAFELDLKAGELRKCGRKVRLQEQPFQILRMLACIIHVVEGAKSLLCYKHVVKTVFEATKEASA